MKTILYIVTVITVLSLGHTFSIHAESEPTAKVIFYVS